METTTRRVIGLLTNGTTKKDLSEDLGISRPTLDSRIQERTKWKTLEVRYISKLYSLL